jgi:hypothetical protein
VTGERLNLDLQNPSIYAGQYQSSNLKLPHLLSFIQCR